jgi:hypothetical protein
MVTNNKDIIPPETVLSNGTNLCVVLHASCLLHDFLHSSLVRSSDLAVRSHRRSTRWPNNSARLSLFAARVSAKINRNNANDLSDICKSCWWHQHVNAMQINVHEELFQKMEAPHEPNFDRRHCKQIHRQARYRLKDPSTSSRRRDHDEPLSLMGLGCVLSPP